MLGLDWWYHYLFIHVNHVLTLPSSIQSYIYIYATWISHFITWISSGLKTTPAMEAQRTRGAVTPVGHYQRKIKQFVFCTIFFRNDLLLYLKCYPKCFLFFCNKLFPLMVESSYPCTPVGHRQRKIKQFVFCTILEIIGFYI